MWEDMFLAAQMWSNGQMVSFGSLMSWKPLFYPAIQSPQEFVYAKFRGATFHLTFFSNKKHPILFNKLSHVFHKKNLFVSGVSGGVKPGCFFFFGGGWSNRCFG